MGSAQSTAPDKEMHPQTTLSGVNGSTQRNHSTAAAGAVRQAAPGTTPADPRWWMSRLWDVPADARAAEAEELAAVVAEIAAGAHAFHRTPAQDRAAQQARIDRWLMHDALPVSVWRAGYPFPFEARRTPEAECMVMSYVPRTRALVVVE